MVGLWPKSAPDLQLDLYTNIRTWRRSGPGTGGQVRSGPATGAPGQFTGNNGILRGDGHLFSGLPLSSYMTL